MWCSWFIAWQKCSTDCVVRTWLVLTFQLRHTHTHTHTRSPFVESGRPSHDDICVLSVCQLLQPWHHSPMSSYSPTGPLLSSPIIPCCRCGHNSSPFFGLLPRDAYKMRVARYSPMLWSCVCLSVCLSYAGFLSKNTKNSWNDQSGSRRRAYPGLTSHCVLREF